MLEITSPSSRHELLKRFAGEFVEEVTVGLERVEAVMPYGETTWKRVASSRGLEADECYYLDPAKLATIAGRLPDRPDDPLPDLAIEIEISESSINKMAVHTALGIPEVWRCDGESVKFARRGPEGAYRDADSSLFLPVRPQDVAEWLRRAEAMMNFEAWTLLLRAWVRDELNHRGE